MRSFSPRAHRNQSSVTTTATTATATATATAATSKQQKMKVSCAINNDEKNAKKRKVLALHGRGGNARSFGSFLEDIVKRTENELEWTFLDGTVDEGKRHEFTKGEEGKALAWWSLPANTRTYSVSKLEGLDGSLRRVRESGPFDCLIGFSQGATLTSVLCAMKCGCADVVNGFDAVVLVSGARPGVGEEWELVKRDARKGAKTSLHVIGERDVVNPPDLGYSLADCFSVHGKEVVTHKDGHIVPVDDEDIVQKIITTLTK